MHSESPAQRVGHKLRSILRSRKISQAELADVLSMTQQGVSQRILGNIPFDINELELAAQYLEIPLSELTENQPTPIG